MDHPTSIPLLNAFLRLIGVPLDKIPAGSDVQFTFVNFPESWQLFVLIFLVLAGGVAVVWLYRREMDTCPMPVKILLASLRIGVLLLLALIWLEPAIAFTKIRVRDPVICVLRDASQSIAKEDRYADETLRQQVAEVMGVGVQSLEASPATRAEVIDRLLASNDGAFLRELRERGNVRIFDFAEDVQPRETLSRITKPSGEEEATDNAGSEITPLEAKGRSTDIEHAIREAFALNPLAAIIIISDGQHTGENKLLYDVAEQARDKGSPVFTIGVGDPAVSRDLKIKRVLVRDTVWKDEFFELSFTVSGQRVEQQDVVVDIFAARKNEEPDGEQPLGERITSKKVALPENGQVTDKVRIEAKEAGRFVYTAVVKPVFDESDEANNQLTSGVVSVRSDDKMRVLLVAGAPTWDYMMVERLLEREKNIDVSVWLQTLDKNRTQPGNTQIEALPVSKEALFEYDAILLFDPNPDEFSSEWLTLVRDEYLRKHAGGLLYLAGPKHSNQFLTGARTGLLTELLPVRFGDVRGGEVLEILSAQPQEWPMRVVHANIDHPVMSLSDDASDSLFRWESMPGVYWSYPVLEVRPTAAALLEHSNPAYWSQDSARPLMAAGRFGAAHTAFVGFNGTWRWRRIGVGAEYFDRFWIRTVQHLADGRKHGNKGRGYLLADREVYDVGQNVRLSAQLLDSSYNDLAAAKVPVVLSTPGSAPLNMMLERVDGQPGKYEQVVKARRTGLYTVQVNLPETAGEEEIDIRASYEVKMPDIEDEQDWLNQPLLAEVGRRSGGGYYAINQIMEIPAAIPEASEQVEIPGKPLRLWDQWLMLLLLVVLLSVEWGVRKGYRLL